MFAERKPYRDDTPSLLSFYENKVIPLLSCLTPNTTEIASPVKEHFSLPRPKQETITHEFGFYPDLYQYGEDVYRNGEAEAKQQLKNRLIAHIHALDQEARRKQSTHIIPTHFVPLTQLDSGKPTFFWKSIGYKEDLRFKLYDLLKDKPEGLEKDRFLQEVNQAISVFEKLLEPLEKTVPMTWELLSQESKEAYLSTQCGYQKMDIEVSAFLTLLFPTFAEKKGETISVMGSPLIFSVYTPSPFHLKGESSFLYAKRIICIQDLGFVGLDQGMMSAHQTSDLQQFLSLLSGKDTSTMSEDELMNSYFPAKSDYAHKDPQELFALCGKIIPFKALETVENVNNKSVSEKEITNYVGVFESIFEYEISLCKNDPERMIGLQERIETFSRYFAHALAINQKLPAKKLLKTYKKLFSDVEVARNPVDFREKIDTSIASIYPQLARIPVDLGAVFECTTVGAIQLGTNPLSTMGNLAGTEFAIPIEFGNLTATQYKLLYDAQKNGITTLAQLREFCPHFGLNPYDFRENTKGEHCVGHRCGKATTFLGPCNMCPVCNAEINAGISRALPELEKDNEAPNSENGIQDTQLIAKKPTGLDGAILGIMDKNAYEKEFFMQQEI